ncbi:hypothetical protein Syun_016402 [Stephania yunnanensis]|uniref:Uncharacterized protein n=1 Tax=Stephania yunnanensis TaxID=152371 RepID=A0AAP0J6K7_9MAGN
MVYVTLVYKIVRGLKVTSFIKSHHRILYFSLPSPNKTHIFFSLPNDSFLLTPLSFSSSPRSPSPSIPHTPW